MGPDRFIRPPKERLERLRSSIGAKIDIVDIFEMDVKDISEKKFATIAISFKYKEHTLTSQIKTEEEFEELCKTGSCKATKEVVEEFEDLGKLAYRGTPVGREKFIRFIVENLANMHADLPDIPYIRFEPEQGFEGEARNFIWKVERDTPLPCPFFDFYKRTTEGFRQKIKSTTSTKNSRNTENEIHQNR